MTEPTMTEPAMIIMAIIMATMLATMSAPPETWAPAPRCPRINLTTVVVARMAAPLRRRLVGESGAPSG